MIRQIKESWEIHVEDFLSVSPSMASRTSLQLSQAIGFTAFMASQWLCARNCWLHCSVMSRTRPLRSAMGTENHVTTCLRQSVLLQLSSMQWKWVSLAPAVACSLVLQQDIQDCNLQPQGRLIIHPISHRQLELVREGSHKKWPEWGRPHPSWGRIMSHIPL